MQDAQRFFIGAVQPAGCWVCLDNFGNGFSIFGYLKHLVAEFVEDATILNMIESMGIDYAKGYYLGRGGTSVF